MNSPPRFAPTCSGQDEAAACMRGELCERWDTATWHSHLAVASSGGPPKVPRPQGSVRGEAPHKNSGGSGGAEGPPSKGRPKAAPQGPPGGKDTKMFKIYLKVFRFGIDPWGPWAHLRGPWAFPGAKYWAPEGGNKNKSI